MDYRPTDGTLNYIHGLPNFRNIHCLRNRGRAGGRSHLRTSQGKHLFCHQGSRGFKNGKRIHVSRSNTLNTSLVATGFPFRIKDVIDAYLKVFKELFMHATGIRRCGSACLDLAYTAEGIFEVSLNVLFRRGRGSRHPF